MSDTSLYQKIGLAQVPTVDTDVTDTFAPLDPARDDLLALFASAVNDELTPAWGTVIATVPELTAATPIVSTVPHSPSHELLTQEKIALPALFLSRDGLGTPDEYSIWKHRYRQRWGLHYVMWPLDTGRVRKLGDILHRVAMTIELVIHNGRHKSYRDGRFLTEDGMISRIQMISAQAGQAKFADTPNSPTYAAMSIVLETDEYTSFVDGTEAELSQVRFHGDTGNSDGLIPDFVVGET